MNRRRDEQKEREGMEDRKLKKGERAKAGVRFMESTYPEIYMNLWQEMRQMQRREEEIMAGRELPG